MPELDAPLEGLARALAAAWHAGGTTPLPPAGQAPISRAQAYAVQDRMAELIACRVAGWKVGATTRAVQMLEGHDAAVPGRIFADRCFDSPARVPAQLFAGLRIECEFAFRITSPLDEPEGDFDPQAIAHALTLHPAIELAGSRYAPGTGGRAAGTFDGMADNGSGAGAVIGPAIPVWREIDFERLAIDARIDDSPSIQAYSGAWRRDPLAIMAETLSQLRGRGVRLGVGDLVLTGSLTVPAPIRAGQSAVARFGDLATLRLSL